MAVWRRPDRSRGCARTRSRRRTQPIPSLPRYLPSPHSQGTSTQWYQRGAITSSSHKPTHRNNNHNHNHTINTKRRPLRTSKHTTTARTRGNHTLLPCGPAPGAGVGRRSSARRCHGGLALSAFPHRCSSTALPRPKRISPFRCLMLHTKDGPCPYVPYTYHHIIIDF